MRDPMPLRSIRCDDATWQAAKVRADAEGLRLSEVIRRYLVRYAKRPVRP